MAGTATLIVAGVLLGAIVNLAVYKLSWEPQGANPWVRSRSAGPAGRWYDRIPVVGWLRLRRAAALRGTSFWLIPMLVEIGMGIGTWALYAWEVDQQRLIVDQLRAGPFAPVGPNGPLVAARAGPGLVHALFAAHLALVAFMVVASLIDLAEKIIPDSVTIPGALLGLVLAAILPWSRLPQIDLLAAPPPLGRMLVDAAGAPLVGPGGQAVYARFLLLTSPRALPPALAGAPAASALALGLGCYLFWWVALLPRSWSTRHGLVRAIRVCCARLRRSVTSRLAAWLLAAGTAGIVLAWVRGGPAWAALLSALVGLVAGGAVVWAVRVAGSAALGKEAMGFGDVTLMMMIGAFMGWQPCLVIFFLAPLAALVVGVGQWLLKRDQVIPYGPFLCLATLFVIVRWGEIWPTLRDLFALQWLVPAAMVVCVGLMWAMLALWRRVVQWVQWVVGAR